MTNNNIVNDVNKIIIQLNKNVKKCKQKLKIVNIMDRLNYALSVIKITHLILTEINVFKILQFKIVIISLKSNV